MEPINQQSSLKNVNAPIKNGLTSLSPKQVSNKNYLAKLTSPLNSTLSADKKTLGPQEVSWTTAKAALASTGVLSALGLSYLGYQHFGTKPVPSPSILPHISMGDLLGTTIKIAGGLGLLILVKYALSKEESVLLQKFKDADENFSTNKQENLSNKKISKEENKFIISCAETSNYLYESKSPLNEEQLNLIKSVSISLQKRIDSPVGNPFYFWEQVFSFFSSLLDIDSDSALAIAKKCVILEDHTHCRAIIDRALQNSQISPSLIIFCAEQENNPKCRQIAEQMSILFLDGRFQFAEFFKKIALIDSENLQEFILNEFNKIIETTSKCTRKWNKKIALEEIVKALDLFVNAQNYKMTIFLLQKCVETGDKSLQNLAKLCFDTHKDALLKASPIAANELSNHFNPLKDVLVERCISEQQPEILLLNG